MTDTFPGYGSGGALDGASGPSVGKRSYDSAYGRSGAYGLRGATGAPFPSAPSAGRKAVGDAFVHFQREIPPVVYYGQAKTDFIAGPIAEGELVFDLAADEPDPRSFVRPRKATMSLRQLNHLLVADDDMMRRTLVMGGPSKVNALDGNRLLSRLSLVGAMVSRLEGAEAEVMSSKTTVDVMPGRRPKQCTLVTAGKARVRNVWDSTQDIRGRRVFLALCLVPKSDIAFGKVHEHVLSGLNHRMGAPQDFDRCAWQLVPFVEDHYRTILPRGGGLREDEKVTATGSHRKGRMHGALVTGEVAVDGHQVPWTGGFVYVGTAISAVNFVSAEPFNSLVDSYVNGVVCSPPTGAQSKLIHRSMQSLLDLPLCEVAMPVAS